MVENEIHVADTSPAVCFGIGKSNIAVGSLQLQAVIIEWAAVQDSCQVVLSQLSAYCTDHNKCGAESS